MENKPTPSNDFENLLRKQLEQLNATPDENTWTEISAKQRPHNGWLSIRHYGSFALPIALVLMVGVIGWKHFRDADRAPVAGQEHQDTPFTPFAEFLNITPIAHASSDSLPIGDTPQALGENHGSQKFVNQINTVPAATVRFQTQDGLRYQSPVTGTSVFIPANSLADANGKPVKGEAELLFREYRDMADFLASGIPMHYADSRGSFFFNSGGMFEVRITRQGEALKMMPGQAYDVLFSPTHQLTKASLFYLDDATNAWQHQPDPAFVNQPPSSQPPIATEAEVLRNNAVAKNAANCLPELAEIPSNTDPAVLVKDAVLMGHNLATGKIAMPKWFRKNPGLSNEQLLNGLERSLIRIVQHKDKAELFFPEDRNNLFTELAAFKDCYFTRNIDTLNGAKGTGRLNPNVYWKRIVVAQENGAYCQISLYSETGWNQFFATLTGSTDNKNFDPDKVMAEYRRLRTERQNNFEALAAKLRHFLYMAPAFQTREEWCMDPTEWLDHFEGKHPFMAKRYAALVKAGLSTNDSLATAAWNGWRARLRDLYFDKYDRSAENGGNDKQNLMYALRLTNFGTYNCDQIFLLGRDYVLAGYETSTGARVIPASVSVMERSTRLFFTLPSSERMLCAPGRRLDIVVTDRAGRRYHLSGERYARMDLDNLRSKIFTVEDITGKTQSARQWAEMLDM